MLTTIVVEILKRFADFTKSIKRHLVAKQGLKPSRLLSKREAGVATGGGCGRGCGPRAEVGVGVLAVGAVGEATSGSQADPVVWVAGQGCLW